MFTGLIEEVGHIAAIRHGSHSAELDIQCAKVHLDAAIGDSIAVSGICLTLTAAQSTGFTAAAMAETLSRTTLGSLTAGSPVNLERALRLRDRLGGHLVSGHVDAIARVADITKDGIARILTLEAPAHLSRLIACKGSVCIDGVSLTVIERVGERFSVGLIPHSAGATTLGSLKPGSRVNLECDLLARYLANLIDAGSASPPDAQSLSLERLAELGY